MDAISVTYRLVKKEDIIREEFVECIQGLFCCKSPKDGAEGFNGNPAFSVVSAIGDICNVFCQLVQYLICVFHFLWGEKSVVENPVILFPVLVIVPEQIHR